MTIEHRGLVNGEADLKHDEERRILRQRKKQGEDMGGSTLKNRSSRFGTPSASSSSGSSINGIRSKAVPLRRPHDGASNDYRAAYSADNGDDNMTVKSNP